jgi:hypothetical protein
MQNAETNVEHVCVRMRARAICVCNNGGGVTKTGMLERSERRGKTTDKLSKTYVRVASITY